PAEPLQGRRHALQWWTAFRRQTEVDVLRAQMNGELLLGLDEDAHDLPVEQTVLGGEVGERLVRPALVPGVRGEGCAGAAHSRQLCLNAAVGFSRCHE